MKKSILKASGRIRKYVAAIFIVLSVFGINASTAYSNSPPLVMMGDTAFPISHDHIKLESETIKIHYNSHKVEEWMIGHEVEVVFNFHNLGPETDLDIGFPNVASYAEKLRDFEAMDYPSMEPYTTEIKDGSTLPGHDTYMYSSMYAWKMHFEENERKSLYVKYWFENESRNPSADYILVTGALWKGSVDKIDVYIDFPEPAAFPEIYASPRNYYYNGKGIEWHFENIEPDFNLLVNYTKYPQSFGHRDEYYRPRKADPNDSYLWDDYFYWIDTFPNEFEMADFPLHEFREMERIRTIVGYIKDTNKYVVNEIYARNGYIFKTGKWKDLFEEALWYTPSPDFSVDKFSGIEKFNLKYINEFDQTVSLDASDEELVKSLENFINKYKLDHEPYYNRYYYKHNYDELKWEKDRIENIRTLQTAKDSIDIETPSRKQLLRRIDLPGGRQAELYTDGIYLSDRDGNSEKLLEYIAYLYEEHNIHDDGYSNGPDRFDEIMASPGGNYIISGTNYNLEGFSDVTRNTVYVASVSDGTSYIAGYGDFDDYSFWWSPSEKVFCYQNTKTEPDVLKIYDTQSGDLKTLALNGNRINDLEITEDMKLIMQCKDMIYFIDTLGADTIQAEFQGELLGVNDNKIYFYREEDIYCASFDDPTPLQVNKISHSVWSTEKISKDICCLYGGASNLSVYNLRENKLYHYENLDYYGLIEPSINYYGTMKPSPSGDKFYIYKDYFNIYAGANIKKAFVVSGETGEETEITGGNETTDWIDNDNLCIKTYGDNNASGLRPFMEYEYNVLTGSRAFINSNISAFKSSVAQEFETGMYGLSYEHNKKYVDLKYALVSNAYTVPEIIYIYSDSGLAHKTDYTLERGSLAGILEVGESSSKICYFRNGTRLGTGWIKNSDYEVDTNIVKPSQSFVYNAEVFEIEESTKRKILDSCSSQVRILDQKPGWLYINAEDFIFGWVEEKDMLYGFDIDNSKKDNDGNTKTDKAETKPSEDNSAKDETPTAETSNTEDAAVEGRAEEHTETANTLLPIIVSLSALIIIAGLYLYFKKRKQGSGKEDIKSEDRQGKL